MPPLRGTLTRPRRVRKSRPPSDRHPDRKENQDAQHGRWTWRLSTIWKPTDHLRGPRERRESITSEAIRSPSSASATANSYAVCKLSPKRGYCQNPRASRIAVSGETPRLPFRMSVTRPDGAAQRDGERVGRKTSRLEFALPDPAGINRCHRPRSINDDRQFQPPMRRRPRTGNKGRKVS